MELTQKVLQDLEIAKVFKSPRMEDTPARINAIDFSDDGKRVVTCDDKTVYVYDVEEARLNKNVPCKKYGVSLVRFTHHPAHLLIACKNEWDETIRYLDWERGCFLHYFTGHRDRVVSLEMSPRDDTFLSAGIDGVVRLWDLRTKSCEGQLSVKGRAAVAYDPNGIVFALSSAFNVVRLFDSRKLDKGCFATFAGPGNPSLDITHVKVSPDGKRLLCATNENYMFLLDSFSGHLLGEFSDYQNNTSCSLEPAFSPDGKFIASGSEDGAIHYWDSVTCQKVHVRRDHVGAVGCARFNPLYLMAVSACYNLLFWANPATSTTTNASSDSRS